MGWILSFMSPPVCSLNGAQSSWQPVTTGVPRGTIILDSLTYIWPYTCVFYPLTSCLLGGRLWQLKCIYVWNNPVKFHPDFDAYLCEELSGQISSKSDLKQQSLGLLWKRLPNKDNNKINHFWHFDLFMTLQHVFLTPCLTRGVHFIVYSPKGQTSQWSNWSSGSDLKWSSSQSHNVFEQCLPTNITRTTRYIEMWDQFATLGLCNQSFLTFLTSVVEKWPSRDILVFAHKINVEYTYLCLLCAQKIFLENATVTRYKNKNVIMSLIKLSLLSSSLLISWC